MARTFWRFGAVRIGVSPCAFRGTLHNSGCGLCRAAFQKQSEARQQQLLDVLERRPGDSAIAKIIKVDHLPRVLLPDGAVRHPFPPVPVSSLLLVGLCVRRAIAHVLHQID